MQSVCAVMYCGVLPVCVSVCLPVTVYQDVKKYRTFYDMSLSHKRTIFKKCY